jgi:serine/threonine protein kinase/tetratricopeptide (TPR) repeat protein
MPDVETPQPGPGTGAGSPGAQPAASISGEPGPARSIGPSRTEAIPPNEKPGDQIGRYKLLQQIGEGGFGVVYMAEQKEPVRRRVALKIIKLGMDTKQVVARFEAERQALALMDHPNIARILDAGATETGRPYFVMELVHGIKVTDYCDQNKLATRERLGLFIQICHAIQHAHQKGVIHRDLKPSNILVTLHDGVPVPKVIDFGIAKATQLELTEKTVFTQFQQFIGTPAYMSPEQAEMSGLDIDTRSDIYSLGVLLYELLTGTTPFDTKELIAAGLEELRRTIRQKDPVRPSTRLNTLPAGELTATAQHRRIEAPKLVKLVRGDLDWIAMKCLEKDRTRRYESASGLATDIQRHLNQEPVVARPPSKLYRFQMLVRRNKVLFGAVTLVVGALVLGLGIASWALVHERTARRYARTEAVKSQQVAQFLKAMLRSVGPSKAQGRDTAMMREILDETAKHVGSDLKDQPEVEAEVCNTIGEVYMALGDYAQAEGMITNALAIRRRVLGPEHVDLAASLNSLGAVLWYEDRLGEADERHREALVMRRKLLPKDDLEIARSLNNLALVVFYRGNLADAEAFYLESLRIVRSRLGNRHPDLAFPLSNLALVLENEGKFTEAETHCRAAIELQRPKPDTVSPALAQSLSTLGLILDDEGRFADSERVQREALEMRQKLYKQDNPALAWSMYLLGVVLTEEGQWLPAQRFLEEALAMRKRVYSGKDHQEIAYSQCGLAVLLGRRGQFGAAEKLLLEAVAMQRRMFRNETQDVARTLTLLAAVQADEGRLVEAENTNREALALYQKLVGNKNARTAHSLAGLAEVLRLRGQLREAEKMQREALATRVSVEGPDHIDVTVSLDELGRVLLAEGRLAEAEATNRLALARFQRALGEQHPAVASSLDNLVVILRARPDLGEAERCARQCLAIREANPDDWQFFQAQSLLGGVLLLRTNYGAAKPLLVSGFEGMQQRRGNIPFEYQSRLKETLECLVQLCQATGQTDEGAEWKKKLQQFPDQRPAGASN